MMGILSRDWFSSNHSNQPYILIIHRKESTSQPTLASSRLAMETPEQCVKSV